MAVFHDRDIAYQQDFVERLFDALPTGYKTISMNQYVGLLHARIESAANGGWLRRFQFDEPYCTYFSNHPSSRQVWLSDPWRDRPTALQDLVISVDGKTLRTTNAADFLQESLTIDVPAGLAAHEWKLSRAH
jgi:hypothetical protein